MNKKNTILKNTLLDLYQKQKLSTEAIAKMLSCKSHVTILNYLKKYNISRRSKLGNRISINISKDVLSNLYYNKKLTQKQIAHKFGNQSTTGIQALMKKYNLKPRGYSESHTKYPKSDFNGDLIEKAYLIGFRLGDLNVYKIHELVQVRCSTTIKEQVDLINDLFKKYGNVHISIAKRGTFEIVVLLNKSFSFLLPKQDSIETWILANKEYFLAFLAGYADAEGSYYMRKPSYKLAKTGWSVFEIQTYDQNIINTIFKILLDLGIDCTRSINKKRTQYKKDMHRIVIVKKQSLWNFIKLIELYHKHKNKLKKIEEVKNNIIVRNSIPYCRPITF